ncbi:hypothetical protein [Sphingobacterium thalpophilum]|uniref:Uncharacterized protein n=1 Tax=Sphingobacterium thalpophilum TaxID=259 RepID=A0A4V6KTE3_9SPHI|nr:hypothetical protein [Sphingobacterium thalpophilum]VTR48968.1 Uncharacterised protein [Sphingobacterium thalpophilum]
MRRQFFTVLWLLLGAKTGIAQIFSDQLLFLQSQTQFMTIQSQIYSDMSKRNLEWDEANRTSRSAGSPTGAYASSGFTYTASKSVVERVEAEIISRLTRKNPASGRNLATALNNTKPYPKYIAAFKAVGLDPEHDYADVFTGYMLGMWRIANGRADNPTKEQVSAVRRQVAGHLDISGLNNADRQEKAAYLIYDLIFANEAYEGSRKANDRKLMQQDSDAVHQRFRRENNLDLRNLTITANGLTGKK